MTEPLIVRFAGELLWITFLLSMPTVVVAAFIGVMVSLFQALTQIQDQTLQFLMKLIGVTFVLLVTAGWMGATLINYMTVIFETIETLGRH